MADCVYPRVMKDIMSAMVLYADPDPFWLKTKYFRRGRIVEDLAARIFRGEPIADDDPWWGEGSGYPPGHPQHDPNDYLAHEDCRPYIPAVYRFQSEHDFVMEHYQLHVINEPERYQGHIDFVGHFKPMENIKFIIDLKLGPPPPEWITMPRRINPLYVAYKRQRALYKLALAAQRKIIANRAGLHLHDGTYTFVRDHDVKDMNAALAMVRAYYDRIQFSAP